MTYLVWDLLWPTFRLVFGPTDRFSFFRGITVLDEGPPADISSHVGSNVNHLDVANLPEYFVTLLLLERCVRLYSDWVLVLPALQCRWWCSSCGISCRSCGRRSRGPPTQSPPPSWPARTLTVSYQTSHNYLWEWDRWILIRNCQFSFWTHFFGGSSGGSGPYCLPSRGWTREEEVFWFSSWLWWSWWPSWWSWWSSPCSPSLTSNGKVLTSDFSILGSKIFESAAARANKVKRNNWNSNCCSRRQEKSQLYCCKWFIFAAEINWVRNIIIYL